MGFFDGWLKNRKADDEYIQRFLDNNYESEKELFSENLDTCKNIICILEEQAVENFINVIVRNGHNRAATSEEIPQYSSFINGKDRVIELLYFAPEGLGFIELGSQLTGGKTDGGNSKYGSNHAQLANMMGLVKYSEGKPVKIMATVLGKQLFELSDDKRDKIIKILLLRNYFFQQIIWQAYNGIADYNELANCLSNSTKMRRKTNINTIIHFILEDTQYSYLLDNIKWKGSK